MKYLGLDYGEKFIGLAFADLASNVSMPLEIIRNIDDESSIEKLKEILDDYKIDKIIMGRPEWHNDKQSDINKAFGEKVKKIFEGEIIFVDESLTSKMVASLPGLESMTGRIDDLSAMLILQSYLDTVK